MARPSKAQTKQMLAEAVKKIKPAGKELAVEQLTIIEKMVAKLILKGVGRLAVAGSLGVSLEEVDAILDRNHVREFINSHKEITPPDITKSIKEQVSDLIVESNVAALTTILEILNLKTDDPRALEVKRKTAFGLLDRGGHAPILKTESKNLSVTLTPERIQQINAEANTIEAQIVGVRLLEEPLGEDAEDV